MILWRWLNVDRILKNRMHKNHSRSLPTAQASLRIKSEGVGHKLQHESISLPILHFMSNKTWWRVKKCIRRSVDPMSKSLVWFINFELEDWWPMNRVGSVIYWRETGTAPRDRFRIDLHHGEIRLYSNFSWVHVTKTQTDPIPKLAVRFQEIDHHISTDFFYGHMHARSKFQMAPF